MSTQAEWRAAVLEVRDTVATVLGVDPARLSRNTSFVDDLGIDARRSAELRYAIGQRFGIELSKVDAKQLGTIGDLTRFVQAHRASASSGGVAPGISSGVSPGVSSGVSSGVSPGVSPGGSGRSSRARPVSKHR
jgi:acyl carrier protein